MPAKKRRAKSRSTQLLPIALCLFALIAILGLAIQEVAVVALDTKLDRQTGLLNRRETDIVASSFASPSNAVARGALANAMILAQTAQFQPDIRIKARTTALARDDIEHALAARPTWGEAWMVKSYIAAVEAGSASPEALDALTRSYEQAPFLRHAADWRVAFSFQYWNALSPATRRHAVDEAVWAGALDGALRVRFFQLARGSQAYPVLASRWRQMRLTGD